MGDFTLACLLGQYDRAQSFDVDSQAPLTHVQSWSKAGQSSWYFTASLAPTQVHSSGQALRVEVFSRAGSVALLEYAYGQRDDAHGRWFPAVETHTVAAAAWLLVHPITSSGNFHWRLAGSAEVSLPLAGRTLGSDPLALHQLSTTTVSDAAGAPRVGIHVPAGANVNSNAVLLVDDVLTTVDPVTLHPEWSFQERARLIRAQHRALGGDLHTYVWDKYFAYEVPLRYLSRSQAELINWWWENQLDLLFTLDSSESESRFVVRIVNESQPIGDRVRPYPDLWEGKLNLESVNDGGLVF